MNLALIDKEGWDLVTTEDFIYFQRTHEKGSYSTYYKGDLESVSAIPKAEYDAAKFGPNYAEILALLDDDDYTAVRLDDGGVVCSNFMDYYFYFFDSKGTLVKRKEDIGFDNIYSFDIDKHGDLWYATPVSHCVSQYSILKNMEVFRFGNPHEWGSPLALPEDVQVYDGQVYISETGSNRVSRIHIEDKQWQVYLSFQEPAWEYRRFKGKEIVRLDSGVYFVES